MPREALYRQKQGFTLPLVHWMRNELKDMLMILLEPRTLDRGYFAADGVRKLMDDHLLRGKTMTGRIWRLLMFELWHRAYIDADMSSRKGLTFDDLGLSLKIHGGIEADQSAPMERSTTPTVSVPHRHDRSASSACDRQLRSHRQRHFRQRLRAVQYRH